MTQSIVVASFDDDAIALGKRLGRLLTDHGLPVDMSLSRIDVPDRKKLAVVNGICQWLIEHKRRSGATEKAIDRQRKQNAEAIDRFINTGETGLY